jgi:hypothetical protein
VRVDEVRPVKLAVNDESRGRPARQTLAVKVDKRKTSVEAGRRRGSRRTIRYNAVIKTF